MASDIQRGPFDKMYHDTNIAVLILFGVCCNWIAFIISLIAFLTAKDPTAKSNAKVVMIVSAIMFALTVVLWLSGVTAGLGGPPVR